MKLANALPLDQLKGRRVFVYKNLHEDCWSVKDRQTGHVVAHADRVELSDVELKVSEAGRDRVLKEQRKNVHAGVVGTLETLVGEMKKMPSVSYRYGRKDVGEQAVPITYNPYKYETFVVKANEQPVHRADAAVLEADGRSVWLLNPH